MLRRLTGAEVRQPQSLISKRERILLAMDLPFGARIIAPRFAFSTDHSLAPLHQLLGKYLFSSIPAPTEMALTMAKSALPGLSIYPIFVLNSDASV